MLGLALRCAVTGGRVGANAGGRADDPRLQRVSHHGMDVAAPGCMQCVADADCPPGGARLPPSRHPTGAHGALQRMELMHIETQLARNIALLTRLADHHAAKLAVGLPPDGGLHPSLAGPESAIGRLQESSALGQQLQGQLRTELGAMMAAPWAPALGVPPSSAGAASHSAAVGSVQLPLPGTLAKTTSRSSPGPPVRPSSGSDIDGSTARQPLEAGAEGLAEAAEADAAASGGGGSGSGGASEGAGGSA